MPGLSRAIGRVALVGLVLNVVIGSSVFGLPAVIAARLGRASPWAWLLAAAGMTTIILCFAEVASRFQRAGGAYLYARVALGRLAGIEMAWLSYLVRLTAAATNANLFVIYLAEFWPRATDPVESRVLLALMIAPLAVANYRGIGTGLGVSSAFTAAKLVPLGVFVVAGIGVLLTGGAALPSNPATPAPLGTWLEAILLLVFAYGGFEAALFPLGEAKDPRRDAPIALLVALGACTLLYTLVQVVVVATLPDPAASTRPLADSARTFLGSAGASLLALGALVSVYGYMAGAMLVVPRLTYAMAEQGDLPSRMGAVHPRFRTPHVSVVVFATLSWLMAASSGFLQNLSLSAVSRLLTYGVVCVAVLVLRRRDADPPWFRIPGGSAVALLGLAFTAVLALRMSLRELALLTLTMALGLAHWWWMRGSTTSEPSPESRPSPPA
jgi:basic amino acid/polyamine antiporter, APA family